MNAPPSYKELVDFMLKERAKPYPQPFNCVVMNEEWRERIYGAFTPEYAPEDKGYRFGDAVMGLPIYLDETYPEPVFRNSMEYLAEKESRDGQSGPA